MWTRFAYTYCKITEAKIDFGVLLFLEFVFLSAFLNWALASLAYPDPSYGSFICAFIAIAIQAGYFSNVRHKPGYVFYLARLAAEHGRKGTLDLGERQLLISYHLHSIKRIVNWKSDWHYDELLTIVLKDTDVPGQENLDMEQISYAIELDFINRQAKLPSNQLHAPYGEYFKSLRSHIDPESVTVRQWLEFLVSHYAEIPESTRQTASAYLTKDVTTGLATPEHERLKLIAEIAMVLISLVGLIIQLT